MPKPSRRAIDAAAWDVFARHQPYYHILSHPIMLSPGPDQQAEFWASGEKDIASLQAFAGLDFKQGVGVDLGCGLGRLTRTLRRLTSRQIGLDISSEMLRQAREANRAFSSMEFRQITEDYWPIQSGSCVLVISLYVLQHMSSPRLMEHSIREMGRISRFWRQGGVQRSYSTLARSFDLLDKDLVPKSRQGVPNETLRGIGRTTRTSCAHGIGDVYGPGDHARHV